MRKLYAILLLISAAVCSMTATAEIPAGYYTALNGKSGQALKETAGSIVYKLTPVSSYSSLPEYFRHTDVYPDTELWWDMYSDIPVNIYWSFGRYMNREHSFPKSWWGGATDVQAYTDLNHLYPSEAKANQAKSNFPLGTVQTSTFDNGICKVGYAVTGQGGGAAKVFEPSDQYKGDFARTYFYMATCYAGHLTWKYNYMVNNNLYPTLTPWAVEMLLNWHRDDPVSQKEVDRNEAVYRIQNNRNPFIDFPELAEYIWGNRKGQIFSTSLPNPPSGDPTLISPVQDMTLDFGQVVKGTSLTRKLNIRGENMTGSVSVTISRRTSANPEMFAVEDNSISASVVNTSDGYWLNVTYSPSSLGSHSARLILSEGGIVGSIGIGLKGEGVDEPALSAFKALPPTNITESSYTANWEIPENDVVDYYIVTRTRYVDGAASTEEIEAEGNSLDITDFDGSTRESYSVQSVRLGFRSPMSNIVTVDHSGITGVEMERPIGTAYMPGGIRFVCAEDHTNALIYDPSGRLVRHIPVVSNNLEVELPYGVYFMVTDQMKRPLHIIVK